MNSILCLNQYEHFIIIIIDRPVINEYFLRTKSENDKTHFIVSNLTIFFFFYSGEYLQTFFVFKSIFFTNTKQQIRKVFPTLKTYKMPVQKWKKLLL